MHLDNPILNTDSYKLGHYLQYPEGVTGVSSYISTRGTSIRREIVFFGLQMYLKQYLSRRLTPEDLAEAEEIAGLHGQPFDREGWQRILDVHQGYLPLRIDALPEGITVRRGLPLVQVFNTDPLLPWLTGFIETSLLRAVWYPSTVATSSRRLKEQLRVFCDTSTDEPETVLETMLADYGARSTTTAEQAGMGGLAHLLQFSRTDTLMAVALARKHYGAEMAGFSVPASEHTTMIPWGHERETESFDRMIDRFASFGAYSVVSDSFDLSEAISRIWGETLRDKVIASGAQLIVRPDSGDPIDTPVQAVSQLAYAFGTHLNAKGFKVINHQVRVLQSDAVALQDMTMILGRLEGMGFSAENIAFGIGASLLQKVSRDTCSFTMQASARRDEAGQWHDMSRRPPGAIGHRVKAGRRAVVIEDGDIFDVPEVELGGRANLLQPVWENGKLLRDWTFDEVRERARD